VIPFAEEIMRQYDRMLGTVEEMQASEASTLSIVAHYRVYEEVLDFRRESGLSVVIREDRGARELLEQGQCEVAILVNPERDDLRLAIIPYKKDRMVFVCHKDHRLADRSSVHFEELREEYFVTFPRSDDHLMARLIYENLEKAGVVPKVSITAAVGSTVVQMIAQKAGVGVLWEKAVQRILMDEIRVIPLDPPVEIEIDLCYLRDRKLSGKAEEFIAFMKTREALD